MSKSELNYSTSDAVAFVKMFYRDRDVNLIAIKEGIATQARTFGIDEEELMKAWIEGL